MDDIEDLAGRRAPRTEPARPPSGRDLRDYVVQLDAGLRARAAASPGGRLGHDDFHTVTAELNKEKKYAVYGKPQVIHEYRACVRDGLLVYSQQVEALLIKKLGKSGYGGVNLSLFIPVGCCRALLPCPPRSRSVRRPPARSACLPSR